MRGKGRARARSRELGHRHLFPRAPAASPLPSAAHSCYVLMNILQNDAPVPQRMTLCGNETTVDVGWMVGPAVSVTDVLKREGN